MGYDDLKVLEARAFPRSIAEGTPHGSTLADAVRSAAVLAAIAESAVTGGWVSPAGRPPRSPAGASVWVDTCYLSVQTDGMDLTRLSSVLAADDPATGLRAVLALRRLAEQVEADQVALARRQGWSWQQIGDSLGITRQSVHAKYGK